MPRSFIINQETHNNGSSPLHKRYSSSSSSSSYYYYYINGSIIIIYIIATNIPLRLKMKNWIFAKFLGIAHTRLINHLLSKYKAHKSGSATKIFYFF